MALQNITFVLGQGNLGRTAISNDGISGYLVYSSTVPSGFTHSVAKPIFSISQAESLGIVSTYTDETKATATISVTGSTSTTYAVRVTEPNINNTTNIVDFSYTYTGSSTPSTSDIATGISSLINTTDIKGTQYSASATGATISLTARPGFGAALNTGAPLSIVSGQATISASFSGGVSGTLATHHYQISEFFRLNPNGVLWVCFYPTASSTFNEILDLQSQSGGQIRQFMYNSTATSTSTMLSEIDALQERGVDMFNNYTPASMIYSPNFIGITDLSTLPNIRAKSDNYVSVVIGQDGGNLGAWLSLTTAKSVASLGACLGAISLAKVSEDIGWVGKFNISNGSEDESVAFINKQLWNSLYGNYKNLLTQLDNYGYIFLTKLNNVAGTYFNDSHTAISVTSDYAYIENNRTIDKAIRNAYQDLAPLIKSPISFNDDGTISDVSRIGFENAPSANLNAMIAAGEISNYAIAVDTTENTLSTGIVKLTIKLLGIGVARNIQVNIGFALSL